MKLKFLGSGSAFVTGKENYHSNILIESDSGKKMLYDCGTTINDALDTAGIDVMTIDEVFISHLHGDHSAGLEFVGFKTYFSTFPFGEKKVKVISSESILTDLWDKQLSASMDSLETKSSLDTYFEVSPLKYVIDNSEYGVHPYSFDNINFNVVKTEHSSMESYALYINSDDGKNDVFISGDTKFTPKRFYREFLYAKTIFHDCEFNEYPGGVHAQFHELKTLPSEIKEKMYLYHYMLNGKTFEELEGEVLEAGFKGLVQRGFELTFD